jgi:hypothetical protein
VGDWGHITFVTSPFGVRVMGRLGPAVGAGLLTAVAAGFLFWIVNRSVQINNVGWLRRQDWPVSDPWVWVGVGLVFGFVGSFIRPARQAGHTQAAREIAADQGYEYAEGFTLPAGAEAMPAFAGWSNGRLAMSGSVDGLLVHVFDFTTIQKGDESDTVTDRTVALVPAAGLPAFDLRPRTVGRRLLGLAGFDGLSFDPDAAGPADSETVRQFNDRFQLWVGDPLALLRAVSEGGPPDGAEREAAVRQLFTPTVMAAVNDFRGFAAQAEADYLAVWQMSGVRPAHSRPALRDAAIALREVFLRTGRTANQPVVPALAGSSTTQRAGQMRNTTLGAGAGSFVGFVVSGMLLSLLVFGKMDDGRPGIELCVGPLVFFGCVLGGGVIGAGIGSRLPVRDLPPGPPEDPVRQARRQRTITILGAVGFLSGFFGGFALFATAMILFGLKFDNFGIIGAIFFGSTFGGAAVGGGLGRFAGSWRYRGPKMKRPVTSRDSVRGTDL